MQFPPTGLAEAPGDASQDALAHVLSNARLGLWDCDLITGKVTYNRAWTDMIGYEPDEAVNQVGWWEALIHPEDKAHVLALLQDHLAGRTPFYEAQYRMKGRDGAWTWIHARGSVAARTPDGKPLRIVGMHLEASKFAAERKLLQSQKLESLGVLAGGIAHDFNNLLTVILGNASLAQLELPAGSPALVFLEQIRASGMRAAELCKQMLAYSGKGQYAAQPVDLSSLIDDTLQLLQLSVNKTCALRLDLARGLPQVLGDATQLRQIVINLVMNASDAIGDREGTIRVSTGLQHATAEDLAETYLSPELRPGDYVTIEVADDGAGMGPEVRSRIFEPFFTTKFAGRGLGLPATLGIARGHRGAITVRSEPGKGSLFRVMIPVLDAAVRPPARSERRSPARATMLVVDDEETVRVVAGRILESSGFRTVLASDGKEAVELFKGEPNGFDAVLLDVTMPHMNGEQAFQEIRRVRPSIPIILMSGFTEEESIGRLTKGERAGFISKPFDRETLVTMVNGLLAEAGANLS